MFGEIERMAKPTTFGDKVTLSKKDWKTVLNAAEQGIVAKSRISDLTRQLEQANRNTAIYKRRWEELYEKTKWFIKALERFPQRVSEFIRNIINEPIQKKNRQVQQRNKERGMDYDTR